MKTNSYPYKWTLKDAIFTKDKGKVFSCFACGGGSTMGYKLAGFDVLGCNEIDPKMMEAYKVNHNPKYAFLEPIQTFILRKDLPQELYELDILDGSPPCSSFSTAGKREKDWGKDKVFREGQSKQVLDTLFFDFIDLAKELQPKVVVAENVKGLLMGNAKSYVRKIYKQFDDAGYIVQHWLLDASEMGVPQRRERVFFIALRKDLSAPFLYDKDMFTKVPKLELIFNERKIIFKEFYQKGISNTNHKKESRLYEYWKDRIETDKAMGDIVLRKENRLSMFSVFLIKSNEIPPTYLRQDRSLLYDEYRSLNKYESCCIGSFPLDYQFEKTNYGYLIGMSVPPIMTAQISNQIYSQWLSKLKNKNNDRFSYTTRLHRY
jgi:DNA (cytosine-5)-methyltransferase 1